MEILRSVGEMIERSIAEKPLTKQELEKAHEDLLKVGADPSRADIVAGARRIPLCPKK
jgi:hypothetical protein